MEASDVVLLQRLLSRRRLGWWIVGGWGVDAILRVQTRPHKDLDVLLPLHHLPEIGDLLCSSGYRQTLVWEENRWLPGEGDAPDAGSDRATAFVLTDSGGHEIDVHVVEVIESRIRPLWNTERRVTEDDLAWPGRIGNETVACMSPRAQLRCHLGYDLPGAHRADVELLEAFLQEPPSWMTSVSTDDG